MKTLVLFAILSALSVAATAQTTPESSSVTISGERLRIDLPSKIHKMWPDEAHNFLGAYDLANGKTLYLTSRQGRMYAAVEDQARTEIVAAASNSFVALNKQMKMTFQRHTDGNVTGELLMAVAPQSPQHANVDVTGELVTIVARR